MISDEHPDKLDLVLLTTNHHLAAFFSRQADKWGRLIKVVRDHAEACDAIDKNSGSCVFLVDIEDSAGDHAAGFKEAVGLRNSFSSHPILSVSFSQSPAFFIRCFECGIDGNIDRNMPPDAMLRMIDWISERKIKIWSVTKNFSFGFDDRREERDPAFTS